MSDRMAARLVIGGPIPRSLIESLAAAIATETTYLDYGERRFSPTTEADLLFAVRNGYLTLVDDQAPWGEFDDLERFLVDHSIAFDRYTEAKYEYSAEVIKFRPGMTAPMTFLGSQDGEIMASAEEVNTVINKLELGHTQDAIAMLKHVIGTDIPPLEPVSFVE